MAYDYSGDMAFYQHQLATKGIPIEELNMDDYCGLMAKELQSIVNNAEQYRHTPVKPRTKKEVFRECQKAIDAFLPMLRRFGFALHMDYGPGFERSTPCVYYIEDTATRKQYPVYAYDNDAAGQRKTFLDTLANIIRLSCHEKAQKETNKKIWKRFCARSCDFCPHSLLPETYNRLKALYLELIEENEEE